MKIHRLFVASAFAVVAAAASAQGFPGGGHGGPGGPGGHGGRMMGRGPGMMAHGVAPIDMLVMREDVQADLQLTDDQRSKLEGLRESSRPPMGHGGRGPGRHGGPGGPDGRGPGGHMGGGMGGHMGGHMGGDKAFDEMRKKNEAAVDAILTVEQRNRVRQIAVQLAGNGAIHDATVQQQLGITTAQKTKIKSLLDQVAAANRAAMEGARNGDLDREAVHAKMKGNQDTLNAELGKLLTSDQALRLKALGGKPFQATDPMGRRGR
ncbi:MAG: hypothetical protein ACO1SV_09675 [Fimbriimonas sp.]